MFNSFSEQKPLLGPRTSANPLKGPRILELSLESSAPLEAMKEFYCGSLGFSLLEENADSLTIGAGQTRLTFTHVEDRRQSPFYHFAFNIPENKILDAHHWQTQRTPLLPIPKTLRDPGYPETVVDYRHWNAHSIFFFDPAGNVVEYIARHDLKNAAAGPFSTADILYASEIAYVVDDVSTAVGTVEKVTGLEQYRGGSDQFAAMGDEQGLLLIMKRGRIISFDAQDRKAVSVFSTSATIRGNQVAEYRFPSFPYAVSVKA
jgi:hypothetical protein